MKSSLKNFHEQFFRLTGKYEAMGQDMKSYLDGLLYANFPNYWNYIRLDTLLTLQQPNTSFPDELIFIVYHQICELYFRLTLHEIEQISNNGKKILDNGRDMGWNKTLDPIFFIERLKRINRYVDNLITSLNIVADGLDKQQFLKFRMSLLPGSGFQSVQFRMIEISSTDLVQLVDENERILLNKRGTGDIEPVFENLYWKKGATELSSGKKTLTARLFEKKYSRYLVQFANEYKDKNLRKKYQSLKKSGRKNPELIKQLRYWDYNMNVRWPLMHYFSASRHLSADQKYIKATGGTNWRKYLPPRAPKKVFFPELWSQDELKKWGDGIR